MIPVLYAGDENGLLEPGLLFWKNPVSAVLTSWHWYQKQETFPQSVSRFSDSINYLTDATRVINPKCKVIASNMANEE
jgi:hypothetical protein